MMKYKARVKIDNPKGIRNAKLNKDINEYYGTHGWADENNYYTICYNNIEMYEPDGEFLFDWYYDDLNDLRYDLKIIAEVGD